MPTSYADPTKISLAWARQHIRDFDRYEADVSATRRDEQRYREIPGYVPAAVPVRS